MCQQEHRQLSHCIGKQRNMNGSAKTHTLLFIQSRPPSHGMVLSTFRVGLLSSVKPFWKYLHGHSSKVCFCGDSKSIQVDIMNINYYRNLFLYLLCGNVHAIKEMQSFLSFYYENNLIEKTVLLSVPLCSE